MLKNLFQLDPSPIEFGTDGWRGILGADITLERVLKVASASAQELVFRAAPNQKSRTVIIGYDRRFLARQFAEAIASSVRGCELEPLLANCPVTTPACSLAVTRHNALGALVVTASHNPPEWLGIKIKGPWGGSVGADFTESVEKRLFLDAYFKPINGVTKTFNPREEHLADLSKKFDISYLANTLKNMGLKVFVDPMHGSAANCLKDLFGEHAKDLIQEIRTEQDAYFGGNPPEPLAKYISQLISLIKTRNAEGKSSLGIVFDGDGDRIAAVDERGNFSSTQLIMPLMIDHMARVRGMSGKVIKTVSGSDLMTLVAKESKREVSELPVGFKYIASEMLSQDVLVGGEESGGVGFGCHLPERDALFSALLLLEIIAEQEKNLGVRLDQLRNTFGASFYDRIDLRLSGMDKRQKLESILRENPPAMIEGKLVEDIVTIDGFKFRLGLNNWVMFRFSGTEPLLRIYSEASSKEELENYLFWAKRFVEVI